MALHTRRKRKDDSAPVQPEPDQAWRALSLVNEWLRHAEAKLGVTLAVTGVSGGVLFNLLKDRFDTSAAFNIVATICAVAALAAGACSVIGLFPILRIGRKAKGLEEAEVNPLFFHDVARAYRGDAPSYGAILHTLTTNNVDLVRHISQQIHSNAIVVQRKYRWANWAIRALLVNVAALAALAAVISLGWGSNHG